MTTFSKSRMIRQVLILLGAGLLLGSLFGKPFLGLSIAMSGYFIWSIFQLSKLLDWLNDPKATSKEPPESSGLWGEVFDSIYRMQKHHGRSRQKLTMVIQRIQESTSALSDGVVLIDHNHSLEWWNPSAGALLGLKSSDDQGQNITNLLRDPRFSDYFELGRYQRALEIPSPVNDEAQLQFNITVYGKGNRLIWGWLGRSMWK